MDTTRIRSSSPLGSEHEQIGAAKNLKEPGAEPHFCLQRGEEGKGEVKFKHNPETLIRAGTGEVLMLGLKEDSLTITFYAEGLKRQFKYHLLK